MIIIFKANILCTYNVILVIGLYRCDQLAAEKGIGPFKSSSPQCSYHLIIHSYHVASSVLRPPYYVFTASFILEK